LKHHKHIIHHHFAIHTQHHYHHTIHDHFTIHSQLILSSHSSAKGVAAQWSYFLSFYFTHSLLTFISLCQRGRNLVVFHFTLLNGTRSSGLSFHFLSLSFRISFFHFLFSCTHWSSLMFFSQTNIILYSQLNHHLIVILNSHFKHHSIFTIQ
jgi:hypothetical protein